MRPVLLRHGGVTAEAIEQIAAGISFARAAEPTVRSPGQMTSHYAPSLPVRLNATSAADGEGLLAFGRFTDGRGPVFQLSESRDLIEAASRLFDGLRWLDLEGRRLALSGIAAMPVPDTGLGRAINDRLRRAAAPRPVGR
jgi:L-threonylcarbamoyladenylate synthase